MPPIATLSEMDPLQAFALSFAPKELRDDLALLYVTFYEWHHFVKNASEPMIGQIKIQWWHDMLSQDAAPDGAPPHMVTMHHWLKQNPIYKNQIDKILNALEDEFILKTAEQKHSLACFMELLLALHNIQDKTISDAAMDFFKNPSQRCDKHRLPKIPQSIRHLFFVYITPSGQGSLWQHFKNVMTLLGFYLSGKI